MEIGWWLCRLLASTLDKRMCFSFACIALVPFDTMTFQTCVSPNRSVQYPHSFFRSVYSNGAPTVSSWQIQAPEAGEEDSQTWSSCRLHQGARCRGQQQLSRRRWSRIICRRRTWFRRARPWPGWRKRAYSFATRPSLLYGPARSKTVYRWGEETCRDSRRCHLLDDHQRSTRRQ
jgi:hypothetical protein